MVVVEPRGTGMALFTLRAAEEVRAAQFGMAEGELDAEMVAIAKAIITQRTGSFDPTTYRDRYQEALQELIEAKMKGLTVKPQGDRGPATRHRSHDRLETQPGAGSIRFEAHRGEEGEDGARSAPAGSLAARSRGSETESTDRRRAHHSRPKAAQTSNCLIRTPFLRHLSRRVVRVEIGQKPGVVRGTGSSNPSPSSGESAKSRSLSTRMVQPRGKNLSSTAPLEGGRRCHFVFWSNAGATSGLTS